MSVDELRGYLNGPNHDLDKAKRNRLLQLLERFGSDDILSVAEWEMDLNETVPRLRITLTIS
jgi:hypothetical protein